MAKSDLPSQADHRVSGATPTKFDMNILLQNIIHGRVSGSRYAPVSPRYADGRSLDVARAMAATFELIASAAIRSATGEGLLRELVCRMLKAVAVHAFLRVRALAMANY